MSEYCKNCKTMRDEIDQLRGVIMNTNHKNGAEQEVNSIVLLCGNLEMNCGYHKGKECELDLRCKHQITCKLDLRIKHEEELEEELEEEELVCTRCNGIGSRWGYRLCSSCDGSGIESN